MRLDGPNGDFVELNLVGYQFENARPGEGLDDANWLRVWVQASAKGHRWQTVDSCLLTWEVLRLADWLESISRNGNVDSKQDFLEPNLSFELVGRTGTATNLRVYFDLECRPKSLASNLAGMEDLWAELQLSSEQLREWALDFRRQLGRFSPRGDISHYYKSRNAL